MTSVTFDIHKFIKTLEAAGVPSQQAEAISAVVRDSHDHAELATKSDLCDVRSNLQILEIHIDGKFAMLQWMLGLGILMAGVAWLILKAFF